MTENLIIFNARVVTPVGFSARRGREMEELCIMDNATVEVTGGVITYVGPTRGEERDGYYQRYCHYNDANGARHWYQHKLRIANEHNKYQCFDSITGFKHTAQDLT